MAAGVIGVLLGVITGWVIAQIQNRNNSDILNIEGFLISEDEYYEFMDYKQNKFNGSDKSK